MNLFRKMRKLAGLKDWAEGVLGDRVTVDLPAFTPQQINSPGFSTNAVQNTAHAFTSQHPLVSKLVPVNRLAANHSDIYRATPADIQRKFDSLAGRVRWGAKGVGIMRLNEALGDAASVSLPGTQTDEYEKALKTRDIPGAVKIINQYQPKPKPAVVKPAPRPVAQPVARPVQSPQPVLPPHQPLPGKRLIAWSGPSKEMEKKQEFVKAAQMKDQPWIKVLERMQATKTAQAKGIEDMAVYGDPLSMRAGQIVDYVLQHHATQRNPRNPHYDLRLGTKDTNLYSWAVPNAPKPEPLGKVPVPRLAINTQLHTYQYGDFAGKIPHGYGAGTVTMADRGKADITRVTPNTIHFTLNHHETPMRYVLIHVGGRDGRVWRLMGTPKGKGKPVQAEIVADSKEDALAQVEKSAAYRGRKDLEGTKVTLNHVMVSDKDGKKIKIPLTGTGVNIRG